jgi:hypothetical protein
MRRILLALVSAALFASPARGDLSDPKPADRTGARPAPPPPPEGDQFCDPGRGHFPQCGVHGAPCCLGRTFLPKRPDPRRAGERTPPRRSPTPHH